MLGIVSNIISFKMKFIAEVMVSFYPYLFFCFSVFIFIFVLINSSSVTGSCTTVPPNLPARYDELM